MTKDKKPKAIAFAWSGLPYYAAVQIRRFLDQSDFDCFVVATKPKRPIHGIEECLGQEPIWVDAPIRGLRWSDLKVPTPDIYFQGGHFVPAFQDLGAEVKRTGGRVIYITDAAWTGRIRQRVLDPLRHRLFLRRRFDRVMVPGKSGKKLARYLGYDVNAIVEGMLGADPRIFYSDTKSERKRQIVFAGRLAPEKNIAMLINAFVRFSKVVPDWSLIVCGEGDLARLIPVHPRIINAGFKQPEELARILRDSEAFVMPSKREAWGVAVHEAALSGCALILSSSVGAREDLLTSENGIIFDPRSEDALLEALIRLAQWSEDKRASARAVSTDLASKFGPQKFADSVRLIIESF